MRLVDLIQSEMSEVMKKLTSAFLGSAVGGGDGERRED